MVVIDADVGDDIDDAYAIAWALRAPELDVRAIMVSFGDTGLRGRLVLRMLDVMGRRDVPVVQGTETPPRTDFTQRDWARGGPAPRRAEGPARVLRLIRRHPGRITLLALAPLGDVAAMLRADPATFAKLRQVLAMSGSIHLGYGQTGATAAPAPSAEYNAASDPAALRALLASGVPITLFPLDATQVKLADADYRALVAAHTATTTMLDSLTGEWRTNNARKQTIPTLFDIVPVAAAIDPASCPAEALPLSVDGKGYTRLEQGSKETGVCLNSDHAAILRRLSAAIGPRR